MTNESKSIKEKENRDNGNGNEKDNEKDNDNDKTSSSTATAMAALASSLARQQKEDSLIYLRSHPSLSLTFHLLTLSLHSLLVGELNPRATGVTLGRMLDAMDWRREGEVSEREFEVIMEKWGEVGRGADQR